MGICNSVRELSLAVLEQKSPDNPRHTLQLELLKLMPYYLGIRNLSLWEEAFAEALEEADDTSETGKLIFEIFDFGRCNMYSAFCKETAEKEYKSLSDKLNICGVVNPISKPNIADW